MSRDFFCNKKRAKKNTCIIKYFDSIKKKGRLGICHANCTLRSSCCCCCFDVTGASSDDANANPKPPDVILKRERKREKGEERERGMGEGRGKEGIIRPVLT